VRVTTGTATQTIKLATYLFIYLFVNTLYPSKHLAGESSPESYYTISLTDVEADEANRYKYVRPTKLIKH
jgi:hypothetical protein